MRLHRGAAGRVALSGTKSFTSGAGHVGRALVTAQDEGGGWQLVLVPTLVAAARHARDGERAGGLDGVVLPPASLIGMPG